MPQMLGVRALQLQRCALPQFSNSVACSNSSNASHLKELRVLAESVSNAHLVGLSRVTGFQAIKIDAVAVHE